MLFVSKGNHRPAICGTTSTSLAAFLWIFWSPAKFHLKTTRPIINAECPVGNSKPTRDVTVTFTSVMLPSKARLFLPLAIFAANLVADKPEDNAAEGTP